MTITRKKLIEVALPLDAINVASAREKSIRHGHPSTLHLWWARRPLAAARAVIFSQMVDDPSAHPERFPTVEAQEVERQRLFRIMEQLVRWENTTNEDVLTQARDEIWKSWRSTCADNRHHPRAAELFNPDRLPAFHDPFAGGGALPLEAQRLGLEAYASDLNPVAVLINKAMIEIPPKFAGRAPVNPESRKERRLLAQTWRGAQGLAEDVRYYGQWMRDEAEKRIGHLYPKIEITPEVAEGRKDLQPLIGQKLTVIAWLWARTVKSPNPAFAHVDVPLASTFMLSTKPGKEAYVTPTLPSPQRGEETPPTLPSPRRGEETPPTLPSPRRGEETPPTLPSPRWGEETPPSPARRGAGGEVAYHFTVKVGKPPDPEAAKNGTSAGKRAAFRCVMSDTPISYDYIRSEGQAGRMGARLMAIVAEGDRGRVYLSPTPQMEAIALTARPEWKPDVALPVNPRDFKTPNYGLMTFADLFTPRQLVALTTFSDLVQEARSRVLADALAAGLADDGRGLEAGGRGAGAYADAVSVYLAFAVDKGANYWSSLCAWHQTRDGIVSTFGRQALPMVWDYAEANPLSDSSGNIMLGVEQAAKMLDDLGIGTMGFVFQDDAAHQSVSKNKIVSTDPPYYDNIGYADLSDFFYIWLRRSLKIVFPSLFATVIVPKAEELVATPYRHGSRLEAEVFFLEGMTQAMHCLAEQSHLSFPVTIYYAFKQSENDGLDGIASTGWETFIDAVIRAGFAVTGTWPIRTEYTGNLKKNTSALASSIVLVCRARPADAPTATRRGFIASLKAELPAALFHLQRGNIAPVDLAQAAIGPGMAVYTRYSRVLDASGVPLSVREALALINQTLDEALAEQEGDFDADSRWALAWFEQVGFNEGDFGMAETLSKAKNTSVAGMVEAGILLSRAGKVRLLRPEQLPTDWDPVADARLTAWEIVHQLIRVLEAEGETGAARLVARLGSRAEVGRELAYRLYTICERKHRAAEGLAYNGLVQSWPEITRLASEGGAGREVQPSLLG